MCVCACVGVGQGLMSGALMDHFLLYSLILGLLLNLEFAHLASLASQLAQKIPVFVPQADCWGFWQATRLHSLHRMLGFLAGHPPTAYRGRWGPN